MRNVRETWLASVLALTMLLSLFLPVTGLAAEEAASAQLLSVTFDDLCVKGYDGTAEASPRLTGTLSTGETVEVFYTSAVYDDPYVGANKTVTVTGLYLNRENCTLGDITQAEGRGQITTKVLSMTSEVQLAAGQTLNLTSLFPGGVSYFKKGLQADFEISSAALGCTLSGTTLTAGSTSGEITVELLDQSGGDLNGDGKDEVHLQAGTPGATVTIAGREPQTQPGVEPETPSQPEAPQPEPPSVQPETPSVRPETPDSSGKLVLRGPSSVTYGTTARFTVSGGAGTGAVTYEILPMTGPGIGKATIDSQGVLTPIQAGKVRVAATKAGDDRYLPQRADAVEIIIQPATITITAADRTARVGDPVPSLAGGYRVTGLVGGDRLAAEPVVTYRTAPDMSIPGTVEILVSGGAVPEGGNYNSRITYRPGKLTIQELPVYDITVLPAEHGQLRAWQTTAQAGSEVTLTVCPEEGYLLKTLRVEAAGTDPVARETDSGYVFTMPESHVTVSAVFVPEEPGPMPFTDVKEGDWFYDSVSFVYGQGLMTGTSTDTFTPNGTTTRGMIVTILYRLAGSPAAPAWSPFGDVPREAYYAQPVAWAAWNGIVTGKSASSFAPEDAITREQMAAIFYRYAGSLGAQLTGQGNLASFRDQASVSAYARTALSWAVGEGIVTGKGDGILDPQGPATRAQAAAILQRFCQAVLAQQEKF